MSHWENRGISDEWYTPKYIFDALECRFDTDVAAPKIATHVPADNFIIENSLEMKWNGFVWCNPPFGGRNGLIPWLDKMKSHYYGIALTPDRTSAPWWQKAAKESSGHLQIAGKVKFISGSNQKNNHPGNGTTLFAYSMTALDILKNAESNGLGLLFTRPLKQQ